jgi:YidC/Oxa1 family membrane protein insertase
MLNFLKPLLYIPFYNLMIFFAWLSGGNIGWAIILVTLAIRLALWWPSIKAAKATTQMQALQPKLNEIKEKHKGDSQKQNEETMRLYKEAGASPLGCCGPMIIQLVVIIVLYRVFFIGFDTANYNLLYSFTPRPEVINTFLFGIDLSRPELWILPILAGLTQMALSYLTMPKNDPTKKADPMAMMNKQMIFLFPIMTVFIARSLSSGLALYWVVTTIFSIGQQIYVNKVIKNKMAPYKITNGGTKVQNYESQNKLTTINNADSGNQNDNGENYKSKPDMMTKIMRGRLDKQDKKKGVEITIRSKK